MLWKLNMRGQKITHIHCWRDRTDGLNTVAAFLCSAARPWDSLSQAGSARDTNHSRGGLTHTRSLRVHICVPKCWNRHCYKSQLDFKVTQGKGCRKTTGLCQPIK